MHFGMFQAGGELSRQTGCEVLMQIGSLYQKHMALG